MAEDIYGESTIELQGDGQPHIKVNTPKGEKLVKVPLQSLSKELKELKPDQLAGKAVNYRLNTANQQPRSVWLQGSAEPRLSGPIPVQRGAARPDHGPPFRQQQPHGAARQETGLQSPQPPGDSFHNPYNFIPAPPRSHDNLDGDLGDHRPPGQHVYHKSHWSGRITLEMRVATPLLIPDRPTTGVVHEADRDHKTFDTRKIEGKPYVPPTSFKGMLRSAFEAVTNSRFGIFEKHGRQLGYRMPARNVQLAPVRIVRSPAGRLQAQIMDGYAPPEQGRKPMPAAGLRLPDYGDARPLSQLPLGRPAHGVKARCWIELFQHYRNENPDYTYWLVRSLWPAEAADQPRPPSSPITSWGRHSPIEHVPMRLCTGYVCITNRNIKGKHDERVFFDTVDGVQPDKQVCDLPDPVVEAWKTLIADYRQQHDKAEILERRGRDGRADPWIYLGGEPGKTAWSPHLYDDKWTKLEEGCLCYARLDQNIVKNLYPVMISRELYERSPRDLLPTSLLPAKSLDELSPADRVFGWANPKGPGASRGNLRIARITADGDEAVVPIDPPLPLAILGQPKPKQGRFYGAADQRGNPYSDGIAKRDTYRAGHGLRGRKVYPHHRDLPADYWSATIASLSQSVTIDGKQRSREYGRLRPRNGNEYDNQNRSISSWIKSATRFTADIDVTNLSEVELGALLWICSRGDDHFYRLGTGKPLGFGSVTLTIKTMELSTGQSLREDYLSLGDRLGDAAHRIEAKDDASATKATQAFQNAVVQQYGSSGAGGSRFDEVPFIKSFLQAGRGWSGPVHYPRSSKQPNPEGENFKWFVANDRAGNQHALPAMSGRYQLLPILRDRP